MRGKTWLGMLLLGLLAVLVLLVTRGYAAVPPGDSNASGPDDLGSSPMPLAISEGLSLATGVSEAGQQGRVAPHTTLTRVIWDDADSHRWIGESWGAGITVDWLEFQGRDVLRAEISPDGHQWALMRTDSFPPEDWTENTALRADFYADADAAGSEVTLEVRGPEFDDPVEPVFCCDLQPDTWKTCTCPFDTELPGYDRVSHLSIVFQDLNGAAPTIYVDDMRLLGASGEEEWDDMDDGSLNWFYFGNWYKWNPDTPFGPDPITHRDASPSTPAGSVYLQWDQPNGVDPTWTSAEVGTKELFGDGDWSLYNRLSADIKVSDADVPLSVFVWDAEGKTTPTDCRGFGTPTRKASASDTWQTVTWDLPWPPCFDSTGIDEVKFVANGTDEHLTGTLYLDNLALISDEPPNPVEGLSYVFENFDDRNTSFTDFSSNWGVLNSMTATLDSTVFRGDDGSSLRIDYTLPHDSYASLWYSLWGNSRYTQTHYLDFSDVYGNLHEEPKDFEQIHFWIRGSDATSATHNIQVELKDRTGEFTRTAYRYITVDDNDPTWRQVVLDADVTNAAFWSYNLEPPDSTKMKQMVFGVKSYFNNPEGTFYIDDIQFVDADDRPFDPGQEDDAFLDSVSKTTFLYFLDWYDPNTGLFQDRSTFPDLMSTASTGFGLTALTIGESRGWIERPLAIEMITRTLHTLEEGQSATDTLQDTISRTNGYKGFYYHFLGSDGLRKSDNEGGGSELSSVDTAILMAGILTAREYFHDVPEIQDLADTLYERIEWEWMLDPASDLFHMAWKPEDDDANYQNCPQSAGCFSNAQWGRYTDEVILINLLALGSPTHPVSPDVFYAWARDVGEYAGYTLVQSENGSFFTYVFAHLWIDFQDLGEDNHPTQPIDWWENSVMAAQAAWQFAVDHQDDVPGDEDTDYTTYGPESWGLTAAEGPYPDGYQDRSAYHAYGSLPAYSGIEHDGTIAPYGAGMATLFLPEKAIPALQNYFANTDLWRYRFGFGDAYTLDPPQLEGMPWHQYNHSTFGIDQGPLLIAIENHRSGMVWSTLARNSHVQKALRLIWPRHDIYLPLIQGESPSDS